MQSNASPNGTPIPAPIAVSLFSDEWEGIRERVSDTDAAGAVTVRVLAAAVSAFAVAVTVTVIGAADAVGETVRNSSYVLLGDVEPEVRLKMTLPAGTRNGAELPLVLFKQVSLSRSTEPQQ